MAYEVEKSDSEWRATLDPASYRVLRMAGTEPAWSGPLLEEHRAFLGDESKDIITPENVTPEQLEAMSKSILESAQESVDQVQQSNDSVEELVSRNP